MQLIVSASFIQRRIHPVSGLYPPGIRATPSCNSCRTNLLCAVVTVSTHIQFLAGAQAQCAVGTDLRLVEAWREKYSNREWIGQVAGYVAYGAQLSQAPILSRSPLPGYRPDTWADTARGGDVNAHAATFATNTNVVPPRDRVAHGATGADVPEWQTRYPNLTRPIGTPGRWLEGDGRGNDHHYSLTFFRKKNKPTRRTHED